MSRSFRLIEASNPNGGVIVRVRLEHLDEYQLNALADELLLAGLQEGCHKLILCFGHKPVECLYSVFLARLITVQRQLVAQNCTLILCEVHPVIFNVFEACHLDSYFLFADSVEEALTLDAAPPPSPCLNPRCKRHETETPGNPEPDAPA